MVAISGVRGPLISEENAAFFPNPVIEKNKVNRLKNAGVKPNEILSFNEDRLKWIQAGCPGTFHDWRNR